MSVKDRYAIYNQAAEMAVDHLMRREKLDEMSATHLAQVLEISHHLATGLLERKNLLTSDLSILCDHLGIDVGLSVRLSTGEEVTFYPARNFGLDSNPPPSKPATQEIPAAQVVANNYGYGPYCGDD